MASNKRKRRLEKLENQGNSGPKKSRSKAPEVCLYCDGHGNSSAGGKCGFCNGGTPLDTQEDWDNSWGGLFD